MIETIRFGTNRYCIETPVRMSMAKGFPPSFSFLHRDGILIDTKKGALHHAGARSSFARIGNTSVQKETHGWTDPLADYVIALLFPELWNPEAPISGYDLSDYSNHYIYDLIAEQFQKSDYNLVKLHLLTEPQPIKTRQAR